MEGSKTIIFGPVPSRRLGHSLGINNIPPKICTYSCSYCQLGRTIKMQIERQIFYDKDYILQAVKDKVNLTRKSGEMIDYLTFVPDGEPTLDINLGPEIDLLKPLGIPIAVITNSSLIWQPDVRKDLMRADWVSIKVDTVEDRIWRKIDRPHRKLDLDLILEGALEFSRTFKGKLVTETMLVVNINDADQHLTQVADFLSQIQPDVVYLAIPTRPPAEKWVQAPDEYILNRAYHIFNDKVKHVEYLTGYEGGAFASTGNIEEDILSITAVHPMREDAVEVLLGRAGADWPVIHRMIENNQLTEATYGGHKFYLRRFKKQNKVEN